MRAALLRLPLALLALALPLRPADDRPVVADRHGPVAGASVRHKGAAVSALTDALGRFDLPAGSGRLTAWKEGYFIGNGRGRVVRLEPLPTKDDGDYVWVDPTPAADDAGRCGNCHVRIYDEWSRGGHARSATGGHFKRRYAELLEGLPTGSGVCASCHAPSVREDDPALFDLRRVGGVDALGVHCDFCHKVAGLVGTPGLSHGRFGLALLRPSRGQLFFGPLDDVDRGEDAYSPLYRDSRYCAACHEGTLFGVRAYTTYSEWKDSPAARQGRHCQHCHNPPGGATNVAPGRGGVERDPKTLGNHDFWDGSQEAMLRRSVKLAVSWDGGRGEATVTLTATDVGHRVPTGFVERHLLLVVEAADAAGRPVASLAGERLPAFARGFAGRPGKAFGRLLRDEAGAGPVPTWRAADETDTRLTPDVPDVSRWRFAAEAARLRVRVLHRRSWDGGGTIAVADRQIAPR